MSGGKRREPDVRVYRRERLHLLEEAPIQSSRAPVDDPLRIDFDDLYRRDLAPVVAVVYAVCGNRWAAEDLAHDAFLITFRQWSSVRHYDRPGAYVRRVALNLAHSRMRRLGAEARALARYAARQPLKVEALEAADDAFWAEVRRLPRRQREVLVLRYVDQLSDQEIAEVLDCAESTVRVHAHRATATLATQKELAE